MSGLLKPIIKISAVFTNAKNSPGEGGNNHKKSKQQHVSPQRYQSAQKNSGLDSLQPPSDFHLNTSIPKFMKYARSCPTSPIDLRSSASSSFNLPNLDPQPHSLKKESSFRHKMMGALFPDTSAASSSLTSGSSSTNSSNSSSPSSPDTYSSASCFSLPPPTQHLNAVSPSSTHANSSGSIFRNHHQDELLNILPASPLPKSVLQDAKNAELDHMKSVPVEKEEEELPKNLALNTTFKRRTLQLRLSPIKTDLTPNNEAKATPVETDPESAPANPTARFMSPKRSFLGTPQEVQMPVSPTFEILEARRRMFLRQGKNKEFDSKLEREKSQYITPVAAQTDSVERFKQYLNFETNVAALGFIVGFGGALKKYNYAKFKEYFLRKFGVEVDFEYSKPAALLQKYELPYKQDPQEYHERFLGWLSKPYSPWPYIPKYYDKHLELLFKKVKDINPEDEKQLLILTAVRLFLKDLKQTIRKREHIPKKKSKTAVKLYQ